MLSFSRPLLSLLLSFHNIIPSLSMSFIPILIPSFLYLFNPSSSSLLTPFITYLLTPLSSLFPSLFPPLYHFIPLSRIFLLRHLRFFCLIPALSIRDSRTSYFSSFPRFIFVISSFHIRHSRTLDSSFPYFRFVIPAKAGIQQTNLFHTLL